MDAEATASRRGVRFSWDDSLIDTVEVVHTLILLGIDPAGWKNDSGKSPVDYLVEKALNDDGSFGEMKNPMDSTWALNAHLLLAERAALGDVPPVLEVVPGTATIAAGETLQYQAITRHVDGRLEDVTGSATWSVADRTVVSITEGGLATGQKSGETEVTATYSGLTARATLTVTAPSGDGSSDSGSGAPPSNEGPGSGGTPRTCTVGIAVVDGNGELLYGPRIVVVSEEGSWGLTALGALDVTGLPYAMSTRWEGFVESIAGLKNQGTSGWMYKVNDTIPMVLAKDCIVTDGDRIIWWYSVDMNSPDPDWADLRSGGDSDGPTSASPTHSRPPGAAEPVNDADVEEAIERAGETGMVAINSPEGGSKLALTVSQLAKVAGTGKPAAFELAGLKFVLSPTTVKGLAGSDATQFEVSAVKLPADQARRLVESPTGNVGRLPSTGVAGREPASGEGVAGQQSPSGETAHSQPTYGGIRGRPFALGLQLAGDVFELAVAAVSVDGTCEAVSEFGDALTVALPVPEEKREAAAAGRLDAYRYLEDAGSWESLGGSYDEDSGVLMFRTNRLSKYALLEKPVLPTKSFDDVQAHWAKPDIELMAGLDVARGLGLGRFNPDGNVTRAEFASLLIRSLGLEEVGPAHGHFEDVSNEAWYYGAVEAAYAAGLAVGYDDRTFRPDTGITREEIAVMTTRALGEAGKQVTVADVDALLGRFVDREQISSWARRPVAEAVQESIVKGRGGSLFVPRENATRAEAVVMLKRMLVGLGWISE